MGVDVFLEVAACRRARPGLEEQRDLALPTLQLSNEHPARVTGGLVRRGFLPHVDAREKLAVAEADDQRRVDALHWTLEREHDGLAPGIREIGALPGELAGEHQERALLRLLAQRDLVAQ